MHRARITPDGITVPDARVMLLRCISVLHCVATDLRHFFLEPLLRVRRQSSAAASASYADTSSDEQQHADDGDLADAPPAELNEIADYLTVSMTA